VLNASKKFALLNIRAIFRIRTQSEQKHSKPKQSNAKQIEAKQSEAKQSKANQNKGQQRIYQHLDIGPDRVDPPVQNFCDNPNCGSLLFRPLKTTDIFFHLKGPIIRPAI
jgi:hypothetical protein